jgi:hypothetical protein
MISDVPGTAMQPDQRPAGVAGFGTLSSCTDVGAGGLYDAVSMTTPAKTSDAP